MLGAAAGPPVVVARQSWPNEGRRLSTRRFQDRIFVKALQQPPSDYRRGLPLNCRAAAPSADHARSTKGAPFIVGRDPCVVGFPFMHLIARWAEQGHFHTRQRSKHHPLSLQSGRNSAERDGTPDEDIARLFCVRAGTEMGVIRCEPSQLGHCRQWPVILQRHGTPQRYKNVKPTPSPIP
jgi:hypothetical protein